uniref:ATP synthase F0 subunit 8 n=1 Tax=Demodex folliculorum TaxID=481310 RepID=A0A0A7DTC1_DEMFO|nr:ATP synthase F0 subunit 8 [Demodex folliculorum]AIW82493.1 ATP synthase F0 subunit 8 [Demodex folliculorum]
MPQMSPHNWILSMFMIIMILISLKEISPLKPYQTASSKKIQLKKAKMTW